MGEESKPAGWWQTLPGILTAIAAAITAIAGLIAALHQAGLIGRSQTTSASAREADRAPPPDAGRPARTPDPAARRAADSNATAPDTANESREIPLPEHRTLAMEDGTGQKFQYTIVSARRDAAAGDTFRLRLRVRVWTNAPGGVVFWSDSFRLRIGDRRLKPVNFLDELAARDETREGDVEFDVDAATREAVLVVTVGGVNFPGNTKEMALRLG
jgi:hypothetical protein